MSRLFEEALENRCSLDGDVRPLLAQWEFDRRLAARALESVSRWFPHYSLHNASHSNTILVQLARVLGDKRIALLSATDLWLLLEAAYHHDIGMIVTDDEIRKWWSSTDFTKFLGDIRHHDDAELRWAASVLSDLRSLASTGPWPLDVQRALVLLVSEHARRVHADRSAGVVRNPEGTIGLPSPRTGLVTARLFRVLEDICAAHGKTFDETIELPYAISGLGADEAHPRLVAFLLRLGDLLDLDNGRFCPVLHRTFGELPTVSKAHERKHASIRHFLVSAKRIEVVAECSDDASYEETDRWFGWLRDEVKNQMSRWSDIAPPRLGSLPSLGIVEARLPGFYTPDPGRRPRFEVDRRAILDLVKGANIYEQPSMCLRELLQNAIDATLLRFWQDIASRDADAWRTTKTPTDLREDIKRWPIRINFNVAQDQTGVPVGKVRWHIVVRDEGVGISKADLRYIQTVASSKRNPSRRRVIDEMPEWMRPSGVFGIGLQSVFLWDPMEVKLTTRHWDTREALEIKLQHGKDAGADGLSIRPLEQKAAATIEVGTTVCITIDLEQLPTRLSWGSRFPGLTRAIRNFDPIASEHLPIEIERARDVVRSLCDGSLCQVFLDGQPVSQKALEELPHEPIFHRESSLELAIGFNFSSNNAITLLYRGAPASCSPHVRLLEVYCNLHAGTAEQFLTMSRQKLTDRGNEILNQRLRAAFAAAIKARLTDLRRMPVDSSQEAGIASLFAHIYLEPAPFVGNEWQAIALTDTITPTLGEIISAPGVTLHRYRTLAYDKPSQPPRNSVERDDADTVVVSLDATRHEEYAWLEELLAKHFPFRCYRGKVVDADTNTARSTYHFSKTSLAETITDDGLRSLLKVISRHNFQRVHIPLPALPEFAPLRLAESASLWMAEGLAELVQPRMLLPFVETDGGIGAPSLTRYVEWTARNAEGGVRPTREVAEALLAFIRRADEVIKDDAEWQLKKKYDIRHIEWELGHFLAG